MRDECPRRKARNRCAKHRVALPSFHRVAGCADAHSGVEVSDGVILIAQGFHTGWRYGSRSRKVLGSWF